jgi:hypothetical protein
MTRLFDGTVDPWLSIAPNARYGRGREAVVNIVMARASLRSAGSRTVDMFLAAANGTESPDSRRAGEAGNRPAGEPPNHPVRVLYR